MQYLGITNKLASNAVSEDLVQAIIGQVGSARRQVQNGYAQRFIVRNKAGRICPVKTAHNIWRWLRANITYKKDDPGAQRIFLPSAFTTLKTGDCKSYATFLAATLSALGIPNGFYFTSYKSTTKPSHVYNWIQTPNGKTIPVDGCYSAFGKMKKPSYIRKIKIQ
jgi:hypothetical protein